MLYDVEFTDTFGGEANYSWVRRAVIDASAPTIMRRAKRAVGIAGVRGVKSDAGDMIEFRPYGSCTVMFVTWHDCGGASECPCAPLRGKVAQ